MPHRGPKLTSDTLKFSAVCFVCHKNQKLRWRVLKDAWLPYNCNPTWISLSVLAKEGGRSILPPNRSLIIKVAIPLTPFTSPPTRYVASPVSKTICSISEIGKLIRPSLRVEKFNSSLVMVTWQETGCALNPFRARTWNPSALRRTWFFTAAGSGGQGPSGRAHVQKRLIPRIMTELILFAKVLIWRYSSAQSHLESG